MLLSAAGGAATWLLRRRSRQEEPVPAGPAPPPPVEPEPPGYAYGQGSVEGREERERESEATDETRYERLRDAETVEREETAERLASDTPEPAEDER